MSEHIIFEQEHKDLLLQRLSFAYAHASTALANFLDGFIGLTIPNFTIYSSTQLKGFLQEHCSQTHFFAKQPFNGTFGGESMLFTQASNIHKIIQALKEDDLQVISDHEMLLELINILSGTLIRRLALEMGTEVIFAIPSIDESSHLCERLRIISESYTQVIVIPTVFEFEEEQLTFEVAVLTKDDSIRWIHDSLADMQDEIS